MIENLKETISLLSDSQTDDVEIECILIPANVKTRAFNHPVRRRIHSWPLP